MKTDSDTTTDLGTLCQFINKRTRQRQADRDLREHASKTQPEKFGANLLHVFPDFALLFRRTKEVCGMERGNNPHAVDIVELSSQSGDGSTTLQHSLGGKLAKATDDLRADRRNL